VRLEADRARLDRRLAVLETRGAGVWGGADFAAAKTRAAESAGASDAGSLALAQQRLAEASRLLDAVERAAPAALAAQLAAAIAPSPPASRSWRPRPSIWQRASIRRISGPRSGRAERAACRAFCRCSRTPRTRSRSGSIRARRRTTRRR